MMRTVGERKMEEYLCTHLIRYEKTLDLIHTYLDDLQPLRVLDLSTGYGYLAACMHMTTASPMPY